MIQIRNRERIVRKYSLRDGVLFVSCYCEDKCYLRINVVLSSGEFSLEYSAINLRDTRDEIDIILSVCAKLIKDELA